MTIVSCFCNCEGQYLKAKRIVECPVVIAAAMLDAMLPPTDESFAHEAPEPVYDGLICPKYALWDSNPGSWLAKEQKSRLCEMTILSCFCNCEGQCLKAKRMVLQCINGVGSNPVEGRIVF
jgi:hypothetical protein